MNKLSYILNIILVTFLIKLFKNNKKLFAQYGAAKEMKLHYKDMYEEVLQLAHKYSKRLYVIKKEVNK